MSFHQFIKDSQGWEALRMEEQFANPHLQVYAAEVRTPTRPEGARWTVVHRKAAVVIAPVTTQGLWLLVRQERIPIRQTIWEFPAGQIEESAEHDQQAIHAAAARELREETGFQLAPGAEFVSLGHFFPSSGFTDEHSHLLLARPVVASPEGRSLDENEAITECRGFSTQEVRTMIAQNEIKDANTLSAFARMSALGIL